MLLSTTIQSRSNSLTSTNSQVANLKNEASHRDDLVECLRTFQSLGRVRIAEDIIRRELVRPWLVDHISRDTLLSNAHATNIPPPTPLEAASKFAFSNPTHTRTGSATQMISEEGDYFAEVSTYSTTNLIPATPSSAITPQHENLRLLYNRILSFIATDCSTLLEVADKQLVLSSENNRLLSNGDDTHAHLDTSENYHILANVLWDELAQRLAGELGSIIFAAGNPDYFQAVNC